MTLTSASQATRIKPNILVVTSTQEPPTWRESKILKHLRAPLLDVTDMQWPEKIHIFRQNLSSPDIPSSGIPLYRTTNSIYRQHSFSHIQ